MATSSRSNASLVHVIDRILQEVKNGHACKEAVMHAREQSCMQGSSHACKGAVMQRKTWFAEETVMRQYLFHSYLFTNHCFMCIFQTPRPLPLKSIYRRFYLLVDTCCVLSEFSILIRNNCNLVTWSGKVDACTCRPFMLNNITPWTRTTLQAAVADMFDF